MNFFSGEQIWISKRSIIDRWRWIWVWLFLGHRPNQELPWVLAWWTRSKLRTRGRALEMQPLQVCFCMSDKCQHRSQRKLKKTSLCFLLFCVGSFKFDNSDGLDMWSSCEEAYIYSKRHVLICLLGYFIGYDDSFNWYYRMSFVSVMIYLNVFIHLL